MSEAGEGETLLSKAWWFASMAERMERNRGDSFGGAFVMVPPGDEGPVTVLILDGSKDPAQFWSLIKTKAEIALNDLNAKERNAQAFGGRR